jgi:L-threonylcarbamoyladenylate synthase
MHFKFTEDLAKHREELKHIAKLLSQDRVGAIPTETFYGLACNPFSERALRRLFELKKRAPEKPILLLLGRLEDLSMVVSKIPGKALKLIKAFWPGPLTLVLPAKRELPKSLTGGLKTIGVRLSSCEITRKIALAFGRPVTGTSANLSGRPPCRNVEEVLKDFPEIDFVVDAGPTPGRAPSTVVEIQEKEIKLIREGEIPFEEILKIAGGKDQ